MRALTGEATTLGAWRRFLSRAGRGRHQGERGRRSSRRLESRHRGRDLPPADGGGRPGHEHRRLRALPDQIDGVAIRRTSRKGSRSSRRRPGTGEGRIVLRPRDVRGGRLFGEDDTLEHDAPGRRGSPDRQHREHQGPRRGRRHGRPQSRRLRLLLERGPQPLRRRDSHAHLGRRLRLGRAAAIALVLQIMDRIHAVWHGGPSRSTTRYVFHPRRILFGTDPVAIDRLLLDVMTTRGRPRVPVDLGRLAEVPKFNDAGTRDRTRIRTSSSASRATWSTRPASAWGSLTSRRSAWRRSRCEEGDGPPRGRPARDRARLSRRRRPPIG